MMNLIKMELFRLVKARGTYITLAFVMIVTALLFMMSLSFGEASEEGTVGDDNNVMYREINDEEMYEMKSGDGAGFVMPDFTRNTPIKYDFILNGFLSSGVFLLFSGIFATNTVCNQYHCGFQKNLSIYSRKKWQLVIAKNIAMLAFLIVQMLLLMLTLLLCKCYLLHCTFGNAANVFRYIGMQLLLHYAFGSFAMCLAELIRSKVAGITLTCLLSLGLGTLFFHKLDELLKLKKFSVTEHTLVYHVKLLPMPFDGKPWGTATAVAIFALILYNGISALVISKRDMA